MGRTTQPQNRENWALLPKRRRTAEHYLALMKRTTRSGTRYIEVGSAFAALEGAAVRARGDAVVYPRKETTMTNSTRETTHDEHAAPREAWDAIAAGYDAFVTAGEEGIAAEALRLAGLKAGDRFLDVAAGSGGLSLPAARLGAKVLATDWAPKMIEHFQAQARRQGLDNAEGRVMDCHQLDLADDGFDVTGSQFGVMLVPDQARALREMVRVTKPGGRVLLIAYGSPAGFEALHCFIAALQAVVPDFQGLPDDPPPLEFQVSDPRVLEQRLSDAGLGHVTVHSSQERIEVRSGEELWNWCLGSNPIPGMLVADLTAEQKASVLSRLDAMIADRAKGGGIALLTAPLNIGIGTKEPRAKQW